MNTRQEIINTLNAKIAAEFELDEAIITPEASIIETLDLDSISLVDLISVVQQNFNVTIDKNELPSLKKMEDLYDYIEAHQKN